MNLRWIPNGITLGNLSMGFFSLVLVASATPAQGNFFQPFVLSGLLIVITGFTDGLDGATARLLKAQSPIGEQLDSLSDMVTFGIAPGFLMYNMFLKDLRVEILGWMFPLGMVLAAVMPISVAYRLARFNTGHLPDSFVGLPSPVGGGLVGLFPLYAAGGYPLPPDWVLIASYLLLSFLMVSYINYIKPQSAIKFRFHPVKISLFLFLPLILAFLFVKWTLVLGLVAIIYVSSGLLTLVIMTLQKFRVKVTDDSD